MDMISALACAYILKYTLSQVRRFSTGLDAGKRTSRLGLPFLLARSARLTWPSFDRGDKCSNIVKFHVQFDKCDPVTITMAEPLPCNSVQFVADLKSGTKPKLETVVTRVCLSISFLQFLKTGKH